MHGQRVELRRLLEPGVKALGFELVDVEFSGGPSRATLRIYIDGPQGVTVDDCADVSRQLSAILDIEDPIPGAYSLEVSSPGLDRPLVTAADFGRYQGETVKVQLYQALDGRKRFKGRLVEVSGDHVVVEVDNERFELAIEGIERARLVPQF
jgi:ribosome maturation factor RimP